MKHVFITSLQQPIDAWIKAFPQMETSAQLPPLSVNEKMVVWVHVMIESPMQWQRVVRSIITNKPNAKVVVISNNPEQAEAIQALSLGAVGYLHAYAHHKVLKGAANVIAQGGVWLGRELLKHLITVTTQPMHQSESQREALLEALTKREREVALEAAKGLSNKEIARQLTISERTVKAHLTAVFGALNVKDRLHLALVLQGQAVDDHFFSTHQPQKKTSIKLTLNS